MSTHSYSHASLLSHRVISHHNYRVILQARSGQSLGRSSDHLCPGHCTLALSCTHLVSPSHANYPNLLGPCTTPSKGRAVSTRIVIVPPTHEAFTLGWNSSARPVSPTTWHKINKKLNNILNSIFSYLFLVVVKNYVRYYIPCMPLLPPPLTINNSTVLLLS